MHMEGHARTRFMPQLKAKRCEGWKSCQYWRITPEPLEGTRAVSNVLALNGEIAPAPTVGALQRGVLRRPVELTGVKKTLLYLTARVYPQIY